MVEPVFVEKLKAFGVYHLFVKGRMDLKWIIYEWLYNDVDTDFFTFFSNFTREKLEGEKIRCENKSGEELRLLNQMTLGHKNVMTFFGQKGIREAEEKLYKEAKKKKKEIGKVYILSGRKNRMNFVSPSTSYNKKLMEFFIDEDIEVNVIYNISPPIFNLEELLDSSIPFYESSNIVPWTYSSPYNPIFVHMYYIVEGVGAFSTFGLEENRDLDVTVFSTDPKYISHMEQQFEILLKYSDLMAKKLGSGDFLRFIHTYCEHWDEGNILSISKYPTLVSLTPKLLKETMNRFEMETMGELFLATKEKLIENLNEYTFTEIIEETSFDPENTDPFPMTPDSKRYLSVEQQIERFEELKRLMLTYENYEVYTYPVDDDIKSVHINPNSGVLLEVKNKKKVGYLIEDEQIIHMLSYYFRNRFVLPNAISKQDMLEKIDKKIESLEKRLNSDKKK